MLSLFVVTPPVTQARSGSSDTPLHLRRLGRRHVTPNLRSTCGLGAQISLSACPLRVSHAQCPAPTDGPRLLFRSPRGAQTISRLGSEGGFIAVSVELRLGEQISGPLLCFFLWFWLVGWLHFSSLPTFCLPPTRTHAHFSLRAPTFQSSTQKLFLSFLSPRINFDHL